MANWKLNIGDIINDGRRNLTITDREIRYMSSWKKPCNEKWCRYTCNVCGWKDGWIPEKSLIEGKGCRCCHGKTVIKGINDIATLTPYVVPYLVDPNDAFRYRPFATATVKTQCPICKEIRDYKISQLTTAPYACHRCGKNTSIYERIFYEFLVMYKIDFITQLSSANMKWCGKYKYDFYFPSINAIAEINGKQHYGVDIYNRSSKEIGENDVKKMMLAFENGIEMYCIFPFKKAGKKEMIDIIYNHPIIDELKINRDNLKHNLEICYANAFDKRKISICKYYNKHPNLSAVKIGEVFGVSSPTVLHALWDGTKLGLCNYDGQKKLQDTLKKNTETTSKSIEIIDSDQKSYRFKSIREAERESYSKIGIHFSRFLIKKHCLSGEILNGCLFKYI